MRDGLLRGSEASALRWGELEFHADGSGQLHVARSKTDQTAEWAVLYLGPTAVDALLAIRSQEAVIDPGASVFGLSTGQISRRIKTATKMAGRGDGVSAHSPRVGMAQDLSATGAELSKLMTARRWTAPPCQPSTPRPRPSTEARWPGISGGTCGDEPQTASAGKTPVCCAYLRFSQVTPSYGALLSLGQASLKQIEQARRFPIPLTKACGHSGN